MKSKVIGISSLPDDLRFFLWGKIQQQKNRSLPPKSLSELLSQLNFGNSSYSHWMIIELKLTRPWNEYRSIRFFYTIHDPILAFIILKKSDGHYDKVFLDTDDTIQLRDHLLEINTQKFLTSSDQNLIEKAQWDELKLYRDSTEKGYSAENFYSRENPVAAYCLIKLMENSTTPVFILDLGCGTGNMLKEFSTLSQFREGLKAHWLGVDFSQKNIDFARKKYEGGHFPSTWVQADALDFIKNPEKYLAKNDLELYHTSPLYILGSGILTENVLSLSDSIQIMQALQTRPNLKSIVLTGLNALHISPYMGKQMGFEVDQLRTPAGCDFIISSALSKEMGMELEHQFKPGSSIRTIYGFAPVSTEKHKERILRKAKKDKILDLSYLTDLTLFKDLSSDDLSEMEYVLLAAVDLTEANMGILNQWAELNPKLLFRSTSMNDLQTEQNSLNISRSTHQSKFSHLGKLTHAPMYSHRFL